MSRGGGALPLVLAAVLTLAGCGVSAGDVEAHRAELGRRAEAFVRGDLEEVLVRAFRPLARAAGALEATPASPRARFEALEALRRATGVDGLLWEGPGGDAAWAGRPVEPPSLPPPPPWGGSFRSGEVTYHRGPYLKAVVAGPVVAGGGHLTSTVLLEETEPSARGPAFEGRWLRPLGLEAVRVVAPSATDPARDGAVLVRSPDGAACFVVHLRVPGEEALRDRLAQAQRRRGGLLLALGWLALLVAGAWAVRRVRADGPWRALTGAALALLLRGLLVPLDLARRFPALGPAFSPTDFGIEDPLGWLASPADFALTAAAFLAAAYFFLRAVRRAPAAGPPALRLLALAVGTGAAGAVTALWVAAVEIAVDQSQTDYFGAPSFLPPVPTALMLVGLVAATAAVWLFALGALRLALGRRPSLAWGAGLVLGAAAVALLLARSADVPWAVALVPLAAWPFLRPRSSQAAMGVSTRSLLVAVLAVALLFPLLWHRLGERRSLVLATALDDLLRAEATARLAVRLDLEAAARDPHLLEALREARDGPVPEGLAFHLWLRSLFAQPGEQGIVSVLDPRGRILDEFTLTPLPARNLRDPAPPTADAGDLEMVTAREEDVQSVIGRARVRDEDGSPLGTVVFTAPDPLDLAVLGMRTVLGRERSTSVIPATGPLFLDYAILEGGRVVRSSDPSASRAVGGFGPAALASLSEARPEMAWRGPAEEGYAVWSPARGAVVAARTAVVGIEDTVIALARLVVVGVGAGLLVALAALLAGLGGLRLRLHHRILFSYFAISVVPIVLLGWVSAREVRLRHDANLADRLETDVGRAQSDLQAMGPLVFDQASDANLVTWAMQRHHDVLLYRQGLVVAASRAGLVEAELLSSRLPADAYRATVLDRRRIVRAEASYVGRPVWFGYAPVLDGAGRTLATVAVPLLYDEDRVEEELAVTGSMLFAAYLLTLVLVLVGGIYAARRLARPLDLLASGTRRVAAGERDVVLAPTGSDELGQLVDAFNRMTRELEAATERAVRAEREIAWRRMARQVAHEIKNPLTPMRLMIQQMEAEVARDPEGAAGTIRRTAAVVLRQIEALGRIAGDFAHFARLPRRSPQDVVVGEVVRQVVELYSGSEQRGIRFAVDVEPDLPTVHWDEEELRRVLVNLVGNAVQAIVAQGTVEVRARAERRGGRLGVGIEIRDTGTGIPAEDLGRLFEPDFSTKTGGTGLGLAIVRRALDDMGGSIEVRSEPGRGSTFRMWWPSSPSSS